MVTSTARTLPAPGPAVPGAAFGPNYDLALHPASLAGAMIAWALSAPPDSYVSELSLLPSPSPRHSGRQTTGRLRRARETRRNVSATRQTPRQTSLRHPDHAMRAA